MFEIFSNPSGNLPNSFQIGSSIARHHQRQRTSDIRRRQSEDNPTNTSKLFDLESTNRCSANAEPLEQFLLMNFPCDFHFLETSPTIQYTWNWMSSTSPRPCPKAGASVATSWQLHLRSVSECEGSSELTTEPCSKNAH